MAREVGVGVFGLFEPEAGAPGLLDAVVEGGEFVGVELGEEAIGDEDAIGRGVHEEGLEEVLLVPGLEALEDPCGRVFAWEEDVVEVDEHAGGESGEDAEEEPVEVAGDAGAV